MSILDRLVATGTVLLAFGLLALAAHATLAPVSASAGYGVPISPGAEAWVMAAGLRDGVLGLATLWMLRHRAALPGFLLAVLLLPLGDVLIAFIHGQGAGAILPHAVGTVGIGLLLILSRIARPRAP
jgi:hypothetical protein